MSDTDFLDNQDTSTTGAAAIWCDASSSVALTASRISRNSGNSIVAVTSQSILSIANSEVSWNVASRAALIINGGSTATLAAVLCFGNTGAIAGAILVSGGATQLSISVSQLFSNRGQDKVKASGAIAALAGASLVLSGSTIDNCMGTSPVAAGAVLAEDASVDVSDSVIKFNAVQGNPGATAGSAAIYSRHAALHISRSSFSNNRGVTDEPEGHLTIATFAHDIFSQDPVSIYSYAVSYQPYDDALSSITSPGSAHGKLRGGCSENPCAAGHQCLFENATLACMRCSEVSYSADGISCDHCLAGTGPLPDGTGCAS